jgi:hypothetical protein
MHKDLLKYKSTVDERLKEITNSLVGVKVLRKYTIISLSVSGSSDR